MESVEKYFTWPKLQLLMASLPHQFVRCLNIIEVGAKDVCSSEVFYNAFASFMPRVTALRRILSHDMGLLQNTRASIAVPAGGKLLAWARRVIAHIYEHHAALQAGLDGGSMLINGGSISDQALMHETSWVSAVDPLNNSYDSFQADGAQELVVGAALDESFERIRITGSEPSVVKAYGSALMYPAELPPKLSLSVIVDHSFPYNQQQNNGGEIDMKCAYKIASAIVGATGCLNVVVSTDAQGNEQSDDHEKVRRMYEKHIRSLHSSPLHTVTGLADGGVFTSLSNMIMDYQKFQVRGKEGGEGHQAEGIIQSSKVAINGDTAPKQLSVSFAKDGNFKFHNHC